MHLFDPTPVCHSGWWQVLALPTNNPFGAAYQAFADLDERSWLVWANYEREFMAPAGGYPVVFGTVTDCLLWIRWVVLLESIEPDDWTSKAEIDRGQLRLEGDALQLAQEIDLAPAGTSAAELLDALWRDVAHRHWGQGEFTLYRHCSIHEYLSELADAEEWQKAVDPGIQCIDGKWTIPAATWAELRDELHMSAGLQRLLE